MVIFKNCSMKGSLGNQKPFRSLIFKSVPVLTSTIMIHFKTKANFGSSSRWVY